MRIGTAVPSLDELSQAPHHFIQHKSVLEPYSVGDFEKDALKTLDTLFVKNKYAVLVGGSGLYIDAITKGLDHFPDIDPAVRKKLQAQYESDGLAHLQDQLKSLDPNHYKTIDLQNKHRVMRALEVCLSSKKPYSSFLTNPKKKRPFTVIKVGITANREIIYKRINQRVDLMMEEGLIEEVKTLHQHKSLNALNTVGYKEIFKYLDGIWELDFAVSEIKKNTRRFAKRQGTWFKKDLEIKWFDYQENIKNILTYINKKSL